MSSTVWTWPGTMVLGVAILFAGGRATADPSVADPPLRIFEGHTGHVNGVAFSHDGKQVLTASSDNTARLWDVQSGGELQLFQGHTDSVTAAALSPDGTRIVTASQDRTIRLWDAATGEEIRRFGEDLQPDWPPQNPWNWGIWAVDFSPDGTQVVSAEGSQAAQRTGAVRLWDTASGEQVRKIAEGRDSFTSVRFSHDGTRILAGWLYATGEYITTYVPLAEYGWDLRDLEGELQEQGVQEMPFGAHIVFADYSPATDTVLLGAYAASRVEFWEPGQEDPFASFHLPMPRAGVFSPDGGTAMTTHVDARARLLDPEGEKVLLLLEGHGGFVNGVAFSPDGRLGVTASDDTNARLWQLEVEIPADARAMGDLNNDGCVNMQDFIFLLENWGVSFDTAPMGFEDFTAILNNWGEGC